MKKLLLLIVLLFSLICFYGCNKNNLEQCPIYLAKVDIDSLSNKKILNIINDDNLNQGVFQICTNNNTYIYFYSNNKDYIDISTNLEDKNLIISCNTASSSENTKKLYIIKERNTTSNTNSLYNIITLKINGNKNYFKNIYSLQ